MTSFTVGPGLPHSSDAPLVGGRIDSDSGRRAMSDASQALFDSGVTHEGEVVSAHRTSDKPMRDRRAPRARSLRAIIARAGGAAHLPDGIPVGTVSIRAAKNAAVLAVRIPGAGDPAIAKLVERYASDPQQQVDEKNQQLKESV